MVLPSSREGYGMVVVEAARAGRRAWWWPGPDNAATELVEEGVNGTVAPSASPEDLAAAILRVRDAGPSCAGRRPTWFAENAERLSLDSSLAIVTAGYAAP